MNIAAGSGLGELLLPFRELSVAAVRDRAADFLGLASRHIAEITASDAVLISRLEGQQLVDAACYSPGPARVDDGYAYLVADYPATRRVLLQRSPETVYVDDPAADPTELFVLRELGLEAVLMLPLLAGGYTWGLVEAYRATCRRFEREEIEAGDLLVSHVGALLIQFETRARVRRLYRETVASVASALAVKDVETYEHVTSVTDLAVRVGEALELDADALSALELGALLHDIGKVRVPDEILSKPAPLQPDERVVMSMHPVFGEQILAPISELGSVRAIVRSHHERWDGEGYPDGLHGEEIPIGARVLAVCDAYLAMTQGRSYRAPLTVTLALAEIKENSGSQFDPRCVDALARALDGEAETLPLRRPPGEPVAV